MSYPRRKILKALKARGFVILREGGNHTVMTDGKGHQAASRGIMT